jgi:hypothetical protein
MGTLAAGGQGAVRRARRRADGAPFAVKSVDLSRLGPFDRALQRGEAKVRGSARSAACCLLQPSAALMKVASTATLRLPLGFRPTRPASGSPNAPTSCRSERNQ